MAGREGESGEEVLFRMMVGNRTTQAIYVVAKLGIADRLAAGPKDAETLARETGAQPDALFRVLRALASVGVFTIDPSKRFALTRTGELLRSDAKPSLAAFAVFGGEENYGAWGDLLHTVRTGETAFEHVFGRHHFEYLAEHPDASATFNAAMAASSQLAGFPFQGYDFSGHRVVLDVGGGRGAILGSILREHPGLRGILYDLPAAVAEAPGLLASLGVGNRCEIRTGSAFESIPAGADLYLMSRLLHDFPDDRASLLLRNCRQAIPADGLLVIRDGVLPEGAAPQNRAFLDLEMLVMNGGRERTEGEWRALLGRSGFVLQRVIPGGRMQDLLEAVPV